MNPRISILDGVEAIGYGLKADAVVNENPPSTGVKYTLIDTIHNVRIISLFGKVAWTVQPSPLELHITMDGIPYIMSQANPITATNYYPYFKPDASGIGATTALADIVQRAFFSEHRTLKIEVETTGGTVQNLSARLKYAVRG